MRFIHTSDLHLGKRVNEFPMLEDQIYILKEILRIVEEEKAGAVVIAGDVYDKPVPPAEAVQVFDSFLTELAGHQIPVFVISGNHDSQERIAFGNRLMRGRQVYMAPVYDGFVEPVELKDEYGSLFVYMLPFIKPAMVRKCWPEEEIPDFDAALRCAVGHIVKGDGGQAPLDPSARNVIVAHQFVAGASCCDSEELSIGGLDSVSADIFREFDYVALGHLHGPQKIGRDTMRYSGTPLKYSFSEAGHRKSVAVVDMLEKGKVQVRLRELTPLRDLREIRGTYEELTRLDSYRGTRVDDYLRITLTDEEDILDALGKLRSIYPNIMKLDYDNRRTREGGRLEAVKEERRSPLEMLEQLYEMQNNQPMSPEQVKLAEEIMRDIW
ncbi:exonuclease SbcCD subunit D [Lacrimispora sp. 210928-DFI.3.58]|uniref:exonuclease SbcCD subunit D n=1 Tax=Lacrimispora sp. 210928-DFI.3.58 TaxID=2883214 RepID=UPI001D06AF69|nr:exonuclease SbcCD subunit D [Lacrimispora sp. 210928-DFI.3.58]MCB7319719.1 exonuclease SbcCD subunit D [Lacrimispora sp. 210928-DFI.3.58]